MPAKKVHNYYGVRFVARTGNYVTYLTYRGKQYYLGYYPVEEDAAWAVDTARYLCFGPSPGLWGNKAGRPSFPPHEHDNIPVRIILIRLLQQDAFPDTESETRLNKFLAACKKPT